MSRCGQRISIIPAPVTCKAGEGCFQLDSDVAIRLKGNEPDNQSIADYFRKQIATHLNLILSEPDMADRHIELSVDAAVKEGYCLDVSLDSVSLVGASPRDLFYAVQTLLGLTANDEAAIPLVSIKDAPRYAWRGMHLDVSRHFFSIEEIKRYLDLLAMHKMNVFHWHLTDDQGWRIEIEKYPLLTEVGAWRTEDDGRPYGGFYTQEEIREIVAYAAERFITVVPEIELPGHARAALAAYPELSCTGQAHSVPNEWGVFNDVYCAGNEKTFQFLQDVLTEVLALFPGEYVHIGGDECPKVRWKQCTRCHERLRQEDLADQDDIQSYFIGRVGRWLHEHGRRLIGWDEILEGGLPDGAAVMSWRGVEGGIRAAREGHDVVMTPTSHCYFDYYQAKQGEPEAFNAYLPLKTVYGFEPTPSELSPDEAKHILGGQGNVWTEQMSDYRHVEYMTVPRICAMAEALWMRPEHRDYADFRMRLNDHLKRLDALGVNYRRPKPGE